MLRIDDIVVEYGSKILPNAYFVELSKQGLLRKYDHDGGQVVGLTEKLVKKVTGWSQRCVLDDNETAHDLLRRAAGRIPSDGIERIIGVTNTFPQYPGVAATVCNYLGTNGIDAFTLNAGCAGLIKAVELGQQLSKGKSTVIAAIDTFSREFKPDDYNRIVFGDAAAIVKLVPSEHEGFMYFDSGIVTKDIDGSLLEALYQREENGKRYFCMPDGGRVFNLAVETAASQAYRAITSCSLDHKTTGIVLHQGNGRFQGPTAQRLWDEHKIDVSEDNIIFASSDIGNTGVASTMVAFNNARQEGKLEPFEHVVLISFGAGAYFATSVYKLK